MYSTSKLTTRDECLLRTLFHLHNYELFFIRAVLRLRVPQTTRAGLSIPIKTSIRVRSLEDMLATAGLLGYYPQLPGRHIGFVTPSGGACDILSDRAEEENTQIPNLAPATVSHLQQVLPPFATVHNPLDVTGYIVVDRTLQQQALEIVVNDPSIDGVVFLSEPPRVEPPAAQLAPFLEQYRALGTMIGQSRVPIVVIGNTFVDLTPFGRYISDEADIHFVGGIEHGMTALGHALWWQDMVQQMQQASAHNISQ